MFPFEEWIELDLNPIISFSSSGKILFSNSEAQFLLSRISPKKLFDLALKYAPKTFGDKTSYINLNLKNYTFYAITVMYKNEEEIHLKLYKSSTVKKEKKLDIKNIHTTNIFTLVDLAISSNKIKNPHIKYIKNYDPSIPNFKVDETLFIKVLNEIFEYSKETENIFCTIKLKTGEYLKIEEKKYPLISVEIISKKNIDYSKLSIKDNNSLILSLEKTKVCIDLPMIF